MSYATRLLPLLLIVLWANFLVPVTPRASARPLQDRLAQDNTDIPLRRRCMRFTPAGGEAPACCLSGMVLMDGQPVEGAVVEIENAVGVKQTVVTTITPAIDPNPIYDVDLSSEPLSVQPGQAITITARYSGHAGSMVYTASSGIQQVDVVLAKNWDRDYMIDQVIWAPASPGAFGRPGEIAVDDIGLVYLTDPDNSRVLVFNANGSVIRQWGERGNAVGQFWGLSDIAVDSVGNVYVVDSGNHRIQKFARGGELLGFWGSQGDAPGQFSYPSHITVDRAGNVYVAEAYRILKFSSTGNWLATWGKYGSGPVEFDIINDIASGSDGNIYVADFQNNRVQILTPDGQWLRSFGSQGTLPGQFDYLGGIAVASNGTVFTSDTRRIQQFSASGMWLASYGSQNDPTNILKDLGSLAISPDGYIYQTDYTGIHRLPLSLITVTATWTSPGRRDPGVLNYPEGVDKDNAGIIYVADTDNNRVLKFNPDGTSVGGWGSFGSGPGQFDYPKDVAVGPSNVVYVLEGNGHRVQYFTTGGLYLGGWGSSGVGNGQFDMAEFLTVDHTGNVYVSDTAGNRVEKFTSTGIWLATWGGSGSGPGQFNTPRGIDIDSQNNIYVVDSGNNRVQKFTSDGIWLTSWGSRGSAPEQFWFASGLSLGDDDTVYVTDLWHDQHVKYFTPSGIFLGSFGGSAARVGEFEGPTDLTVLSDGRLAISDGWANQIQVFRQMNRTAPVASIVHLSAVSIDQSQTLTLLGMGQDTDPTPAITAYSWAYDNDIFLAMTDVPSLTLNGASLSVGTHKLKLKVRDSEGEWSEWATEDVYIATVPQHTWTMLLYLDGDDNDGGQMYRQFQDTLAFFQTNLSNPAVRVAAIIDGPGQNDTNLFAISPGQNGTAPVVEKTSLGERKMNDPATLREFLLWAQGRFHAQQYYLAIADHGQAIRGIAWDHTSDISDNGVADDSAYMTVKGIASALGSPNVAPISVLHLDACSMDLLDVAYELRPYADVLIASQYLGWGYFLYDQYQSMISPSTTPSELGKEIVDRYASRAEQSRRPYTLAALDLSRMDALTKSVTAIALNLKALAQQNPNAEAALATIWTQSRKFDSNSDRQNDSKDAYVDLLDWTQKVAAQFDDQTIRIYASEIVTELSGSPSIIIRNKALSNPLPQSAGGSYIDLTRSGGISIFYPERQNSVAFSQYVNDQLFTFTSAYDGQWKHFLQGVSSLSPGGDLDPLPSPSQPLHDPDLGALMYQIWLPLINR